MLRYLLLTVLLLFPLSVFPGQKNKNEICVWADKNNMKHYENCQENSLVVRRVYIHEELKNRVRNKNSFPENISVPLSVSAPIILHEVIYDNNVKVKLSGCETLQDSIDKTFQGSGSSSVLIRGKGRTEKQICETVGRGCAVCQVSLP